MLTSAIPRGRGGKEQILEQKTHEAGENPD